MARAVAPAQTYATLRVPEEAIDTVRETGSVVLTPKNAPRTMVVLVHSNRDSLPSKARAGLALRENLLDDAMSPQCHSIEAPPTDSSSIAKRPISKRPPRVIAVTNHGQLNLFAGMLRFVFLRPVYQPSTPL